MREDFVLLGVHPDWQHGGGPRLVLALALALLSGCAGWWDEVTSREHKFGDSFKAKPDPLVTLRESTDGARRGEAYAALKEPLRNGGSQQDQDLYLDLLGKAALGDREPYCRLCAIGSLGGFHDPRAPRILEKVYQETKLPFTQDFNNRIRTEALVALEKNGDDESRHLLIRVARQPGPASGEHSQSDRQQTLDEKLVAIRALGKFKHQDCIETLAYIMKTEKDVAIRDRAHDSLELVTGRKLPNEPEAIQAEALVPGDPPPPNIIERVAAWTHLK